MSPEVAEKKMVGFEVVEKEIDMVNGEVVGKVVGSHVGKAGFVKVTIEGGFSALPFIVKGIDWLEEKIPGDQKVYATLLKDAAAKFKF